MPEIVETRRLSTPRTLRRREREMRADGIAKDVSTAIGTSSSMPISRRSARFSASPSRRDCVQLMGGGSLQKPRIYFSGFWSQGDGACFEGRYAHARRRAQSDPAIRATGCGAARNRRRARGHSAPQFLPALRRRLAIRVNITTRIAWRCRSSATARPGRT